jgi:hypothetical protein
MPLPDYLLICPLSFNALCTSFEVIDNTRLKQKEVNALVRLLETIGWLRQGETKEPDKK